MARIRAVSFDVGGTLIEPWPSVGHVYAQTAEEAGLPAPDVARVNRQFLSAWRMQEGFDYTEAAWEGLVHRTFDGILASEAVHQLFPLVFRRFAEARSWHIYTDVLPTLHALRSVGFRLAVTSNWDHRLRPTLAALGLADHFDTVTVSAEVGYHKPAPQIFQRTCRTLSLAPEHVLHVGDSQREDIEGGRQAGLPVLHVQRSPAVSAGLGSLTSLAQLPTWLAANG